MPRCHRKVDPPNQRPLQNLERVALTAGNYVNVADGVSLTLHRVVEALQRRGVEVAVIAPDGEHPDLPEAPHMIPVPSVGLPIQKGYRMALGLNRQTIAAIDRFAPQLVHVATPDLAGWMAAHYARRRGLSLISTYHTNFAAYLDYWGMLPSMLTSVAWQLKRSFYARFDQVFVPTRALGEELVQRGVLRHYSVLARGVDQRRFHRRCRSENWRQSLGIASDEKIVLFCARLVWEKGLRTLVRALHWMRHRGLNFRSLIVGDGAQKKWLQRQLPQAQFTGFLTHGELACAYASSDLFLYPSTTDTFGNVTLEAMACGLPVVGARAPGTRTLVQDGTSGVLVRRNDPQALARAAIRLIEDDTERRRLADGAARRARQFRWSEILSRFSYDLDRLVA